MHLFAHFFIFFTSFTISAHRGIAAGFWAVFLPVVILLWRVETLVLPALPDFTVASTSVCGIALGALSAGKRIWVGLKTYDYALLFACGVAVASAVANESVWSGFSRLVLYFLTYFCPYYLARLAFRENGVDRRAIAVVLFVILVVAILAVLEARLWPKTAWTILYNIGLYDKPFAMVQGRFGLFRPVVTFSHPIYFGNCMLLIGGLVALILDFGHFRTRKIARLVMACCSFMILLSMSFTCYLGFAVTFVMALIMLYTRITLRRAGVVYLWASVIIVNVFMFSAVSRLAGERVQNDMGQTLEDSLLVRSEIYRNSLPALKSAGFFGHGEFASSSLLANLNTGTTDNAYILFVVWHGWLFLVAWIAFIALVFMKASQVLNRNHSGVGLQSGLLISIACVLGSAVAMMTVWQVPQYITLLLCLIGGVASRSEIKNRKSERLKRSAILAA